jgi:hypothetical protein
LIQPTTVNIKYRTNLNPAEQPDIPVNTQVIDITDIIISVDEEVYKDM